MGQPVLAEDALVHASGLFVAQDNRVGAAAIDLARAELAVADGRDREALRLAQQAGAAYSEAALVEGNARAEVIRAQALLQLGEVDQARKLYDETLQLARQRQLLPVELRCLIGQGRVAQCAKDGATARAAFESAISLFEDQRRALPGDEIRSAFLSDHLLPFRELLRMALDAMARTASRENADQVLHQQERFRARTLGDRLVQAPQSGADAESQDLRSRLNWLYRRLRRAQEDAEPATALADEVRSMERELLERVRRQRLVADSTPARGPFEDDFSAERLRAALGADDALVEYGVIDDELFACIVTSDAVSVHRGLASWSDAVTAVRSARFQIETLRYGAAPVAHQLDILTRRSEKRMQQLHALLWARLQEALAPYRRIAIVPHAQLAMLPFGALHDGRRFLAESVELATVPSARIALHRLRRAAKVPERALVLGESASLPHAEQEARFVASLFPASTVLTGSEATIAALYASAEHADVIHLACHAQFRSDSPMFSALHLHDGALTAESIEALKLRAGIVVLSACETGLAETGSGDEMVGLVRAFLIAGAARIVASLWPVDDRITAEFMARFYPALSEGRSPAAALRSAQEEIMRRHPHPFYWAGFSLFGGW
jgi:tetratricopeptide (TPR) repeat protein